MKTFFNCNFENINFIFNVIHRENENKNKIIQQIFGHKNHKKCVNFENFFDILIITKKYIYYINIKLI